MPHVSGIQFIARAKQESASANAQFVLLSSIDSSNDVEALSDLGFAACLSKPVRMTLLHECLNRILMPAPNESAEINQPVLTQGRIEAVGMVRRYSGAVLVVEDNRVNQKVAQRFLERMGFSVVIADNGEAGLKAFESAPFDLIFMDVQMPVMDGYEATRRIRAIEPAGQSRTPIIALTADAMPEHLDMCRSAGMDDCLSKPIEVDQLRAVIDKFLVHGTDRHSSSQVEAQRLQSTSVR
jgi:CheY-like chemotaxis protein